MSCARDSVAERTVSTAINMNWPDSRDSCSSFARLLGLEQPRVLDRDHGLIGEGLLSNSTCRSVNGRNSRRIVIAGPNISYRLERAYHNGPNRGGGIRRFEAAS